MEPEKAPEAISRAVASLPPEQMFELMKQMKVLYVDNLAASFKVASLRRAQLLYFCVILTWDNTVILTCHLQDN